MKLKLIAILFSTTLFINAQTLISHHKSDLIDSSVYLENNIYHYIYTANNLLDNKKLSRVTVNLYDDNIFNVYSEQSSENNFVKNGIRFGDIDSNSYVFKFGYYSEYSPELSTALLKYGKNTYINTTLTTSGCIPEPSNMGFLSSAILFFFRRRV